MANEQRLIDSNALKVKYCEVDNNPGIWTLSYILKWLELSPTIEAEPVVHAYWELYNENSDDYWKRGWRCSHCKGYHFHNGGMIKKYKRCPNCGAHMDLKEADHDPG